MITPLLQWNFGAGRARQLFSLFDRVTRFSIIYPNEENDGVLWQAYLAGDFKERLDKSRFLESLLPHSRLVAEKDDSGGIGRYLPGKALRSAL